MPASPFQLYEAVVLDSAPDGAPAGHITVSIPELYGDDEVPVTIAPLFPGWSAGWQGVPAETTPDGEQTRIIVAMLGPETFRWLGTSQAWAFITDNAGLVAGSRSPDGRHSAYLSNDDGAVLSSESAMVRVNGGTIEMFDGGQVPPTDAYILSTQFVADLMLVMQDIIAIGTATIPPVPAVNAAAMLTKLGTSQAAGAPYLSTKIFGS